MWTANCFVCIVGYNLVRHFNSIVVRISYLLTLSNQHIDNIKMDLLEIVVNVVDWIGLAQDRYRWRALVNSVMNLRVP
jgi:hypothetical protein